MKNILGIMKGVQDEVDEGSEEEEGDESDEADDITGLNFYRLDMGETPRHGKESISQLSLKHCIILGCKTICNACYHTYSHTYSLLNS